MGAAASAENFYAPVIGKMDGGGGHNNTFCYYLYAGDYEHRPFGEIENPLGTGRSVTAAEPVTPKAWTHVALTFDGAEVRLYVNGVKVDEATASAPVTTEGELEIGAETEHGDFFKGRIDEVRVYDRALNGAEVAADMEAPIQTPRQGPVAAYSFDEGSGETVEDVTGDGHTATLQGAKWTPHGRYGGAWSSSPPNMTISRSRLPRTRPRPKNSPSRPGCGPTRNPASTAPLITKQTTGNDAQPYASTRAQLGSEPAVRRHRRKHRSRSAVGSGPLPTAPGRTSP